MELAGGGARETVAEDLGRRQLTRYAVQKLIELDGFDSFASNMEKDAPSRFKDWFNEIAPEECKLPLDWKKLDAMPFQKLLVLR